MFNKFMQSDTVLYCVVALTLTSERGIIRMACTYQGAVLRVHAHTRGCTDVDVTLAVPLA